ncbi:MAG TPA: acid-shock protein [Alphaproteobacteria bacterium]
MKISTLALAIALAAGFGLTTAAFAQTNSPTTPAPAASPSKTAKPAHKTVQHKAEKSDSKATNSAEAVKK